MKFRTTIVNEPKNRKAALNLAVIVANNISQNKTRKENLMESRRATRAKLQKLEVVLKDIESKIKEAEESDSINETTLKNLINDWNLTEAEILELQSSSLREKLKDLEKQKLIQDKKETLK